MRIRPILAITLAMALAIITTSWGDRVAAAEKPLPRASLWVARSAKDEIVKLDSEGKVLARIDACCEPRSVGVGAGAVWFTTDEGSVLRVDPTTSRVVATIPVGTRAGAITTGGDAVWMAEPDAREVVRIDPVSNAVVARLAVGTAESCPSWLTADAASV
jgi:streptogramin lyase